MIKTQISGTLLTISLFGLNFLILQVLENSIFVKIENINYPEFNYKIIYSLIFSFIAGLTLIKNKDINTKGAALIITIIIIGFIIDTLLIFETSDYQISSIVKAATNINYKALYYLPVYALLLLLSKRLLLLIDAQRLINRIPAIIKIQKTNIARLVAFVIDWTIVVIIGTILYKSRIIKWFPIEILFVNFAYRFVMESTFSRTIGKIICGLTIVKMNIKSLTLKDILLRNISRAIVLYWVPIIFNKEGIHNRLSKTKIEKTCYNTTYM